MKKYLIYLFQILILIGGGIFTSCTNNYPDDSPYIYPSPEETRHPYESTLLIYAVATNSLSGNFVDDKREMVDAAPNIDLENNNVFIFQTIYGRDAETGDYYSDVSLVKLVKTLDEYGWETVKTYDNNIASLNPSRISEVVDYITSNYPSKSYGMVFWSHSTASQPFFSSTRSEYEAPMAYSFGQDKTAEDVRFEQINVNELADALPDHLFNYIWFDSCYMSNIETIYEFKDKCNYYVAYPTEVLDSGLPYNLVLPYMTGENPDLLKAADTFFQYYTNTFGTIAVIDMEKMVGFAGYCSQFLNEGVTVSASNLFKYTRYSTGPFYDLGEYVKNMMAAQEIADDEVIEFDRWLNDIILYKNTTTGNYYDIKLGLDPARFSGISTHVYTFEDSDTETEAFYKSLDWYSAAFLGRNYEF